MLYKNKVTYTPPCPTAFNSSAMNGPTLSGIRVRSTRDARFIFHAVAQHKLPLVTRRLTSEERRTYIRAGTVFVWEERGPTSDSPRAGIERWTDGKHWGPSRVRDEFLFYHEQPRVSHKRSQESPHLGPQEPLVKQTFSVWVDTPGFESRKWHLVAYYTQEILNQLGTIDSILDAPPSDPEREYRSARTTRGRPRGEDLLHEQTSVQRPGVQLYPLFVHDFPRDRHHTTGPTGGATSILRASSTHDRPGSIMLEGRHRRAGRDEDERILAPLIYLQNSSAPPRPPVDDFAIRALDSYMV